MSTQAMAPSSQTLLEVEGLKKHFPVGKKGLFSRHRKVVKAVDGVTFDIRRGETLGIVGESGCGKSTMGRAILRLHEPSAGTIRFEGEDMMQLSRREMRKKRKEMQMIFQDPYGSLNPRMTVGAMLSEIVRNHRIVPLKETADYIYQLLQEVGLGPQHFHRFPHEFSGGQRQRIGIARALCVNPKLVVCDEAVSALDVSVQSQILNLLVRLRKEHDLTYLFISHDLSVVKHISDRVGVMYLGRMVELADKQAIYANPKHPYTQALLSAIPSTDIDKKRERIILKGDVPSPLNIPSGCRFHPRCPVATDECRHQEPEFRQVGEQHYVACHLV
ncbi:oligopeptide/dipeptide ABC transporter ATP-binding protein [Caldalkalibacillus uzonensis]|uniref:Oligopeptide/dipeptide ABC transporter ATP-binding protein n=1 Tax=Caldalkalibacillus uzonensis TaxID=353224 RepID=A0ABU0CQ36_9BACI|nr:dipeptide ABC transporter ATP-binding protein [Caldalkalibacillus uzonensis]MDQ0338529.1 oligopeptide/dipeptide ABC transporter ATP-binding protein [Caldalkalibacillus uzonensis]